LSRSFAVIAFTAATLVACGPPVTVRGERSRIATFPRYRTYAWASPATPAASPAETAASLLDWRIHEAVDRGLAAKGYVRTDGPATLLVDYDVVTRADDSTAFRDFFAAREQVANRALGVAFARGFPRGTLLVHLVDARTGELAYRAWATHLIHEGENPGRVDDAIRLMLADLPQVTGDAAAR
jgi:hypothetical protein